MLPPQKYLWHPQPYLLQLMFSAAAGNAVLLHNAEDHETLQAMWVLIHPSCQALFEWQGPLVCTAKQQCNQLL